MVPWRVLDDNELSFVGRILGTARHVDVRLAAYHCLGKALGIAVEKDTSGGNLLQESDCKSLDELLRSLQELSRPSQTWNARSDLHIMCEHSLQCGSRSVI